MVERTVIMENNLMKFHTEVRGLIEKQLKETIMGGNLKGELLCAILRQEKNQGKKAIKKAKKKGEKQVEIRVLYTQTLQAITEEIYRTRQVLLNKNIYVNQYTEEMRAELSKYGVTEDALKWAKEYEGYLECAKIAVEDYIYAYPNVVNKPVSINFVLPIADAEGILNSYVEMTTFKSTEVKARILNKEGIVLEEKTVSPEIAEKLIKAVKENEPSVQNA